MKMLGKFAFSSVCGATVFALLLFLPAGTWRYWQGWVFLAVFALCTSIPSIYLLRTNPAALERRMHAGPFSETRMTQKVIISVAAFSLLGMIVLSALDYRFNWSSVPAAVSLAGDVLVAIGLSVAMLVVVQNAYAAANVTVEAGQRLVSTGLYGLVRHPMYAGDVIMMVGIPLALGSYWALLLVIPGLVALALRIRDEEQLLAQELSGYDEYRQRVRYRLVPYAW